METNLLLKKPKIEIKGGKYLVFLINGNHYGIPILDTSEINGIMNITPIPKTPEYIKGIINLRGKIIPVMDLRLRFGMEQKEYNSETCIIIINLKFNQVIKQIGIIVDTVSEVFDLPASDIERPPSYDSDDDNEFLDGIGKVKNKIIMLLNIKKILQTKEMTKILSDKKGE